MNNNCSKWPALCQVTQGRGLAPGGYTLESLGSGGSLKTGSLNPSSGFRKFPGDVSELAMSLGG